MSNQPRQILLVALAALGVGTAAPAQDAVRLREQFPSGYVYQVSCRVELSGALTLPLEKGQTTPKTLTVTGKSAIDYDERVLTAGADNQVQKTARFCRRMEFERAVGKQQEQAALRPAVRRLVLLRHGQKEVPFSPDGPLTWGEIDLIRTDVFTPALQGLLPEQAVRPGDRWKASAAAVLELTDMERLDEGGLDCVLVDLTTLAGRRHARVAFKGTVRGPGEDGVSRHELDGYLFFDLASNHLSYLSMRGVQSLLDKDSKAVSKVEGSFVLTRRPLPATSELGDAALRAVGLEPTAENTLLLYDNPELGVRFLYPRRWHIQGVRGRQVAVDERQGSGLLLTVEPLARVPTGEQYLKECLTYLQKEKVTVTKGEMPRLVQKGPPQVEQFSLDLVVGKEQVRMEYFVVRDAAGGATLAARLLPTDRAALQQEVRQMALSLRVARKQ
jgi:hypothetical protein